ncbi:unnamed protein product [Paramecium sonneborni]|uniref:Uncharacterized protein n=1 Tax=Paramecium sonneborni TaxID=65129 RepID=A0A8S1R0H9_9CILI|nr:unnamed protein product [Paramecium sonneborni]
MQFQNIKKELFVKQTPKHESCIAKIFNYNPSQKMKVPKKQILQSEQPLCNQVFIGELFFDCQIP